MSAVFFYLFVATTSAKRMGGGKASIALRMRADKTLAHLYTPKTQNQRQYYKFLADNDVNIVVCSGPAGSGKTALACHYAIEKYKQGAFKKIVITRPLVTVEEDIGFLPGTLNKKMEPWTRPMMDIFNEYYPMSVLNNMVKDGIIEISPLAFMRGRTFKDAIIIADEMQNSSPNQMLMVLTRIGDASKLVITGDMKQADMTNSGLSDFLRNYRVSSSAVDGLTKHVKVVELDNSDIVRHHVVSKILDLYQGGSKTPVLGTNTPSDNLSLNKGDPSWNRGPEDGGSEGLGAVGAQISPDRLGNHIKGLLTAQEFVSEFRAIPDFTGNSTAAGEQDCALIPRKDEETTKKYNAYEMRGSGATECLFDDICFTESVNVTYRNDNHTQIRRR